MSTKLAHLSFRREFRTSILVLLAGGLGAASCGFDETGSFEPPKTAGSTGSSASSSGDAVGGGGGNGAGGAGGAAGMGGAGGNAPCSTGFTDCQGVCVDTTSDENHCGGCGTVCDPEWTCEASGCKAPPVCVPGSTMPCYTGPAGTEGQGICAPGTRTCLADGSGYDLQCNGEVLPGTEVCGNDVDEDCDGKAQKASECLVSNGLIVRYFLDEATSGKGPMMAMDSAPTPLNLPINYGGSDNLQYASAATGNGLRWANHSSSGTASAPIDGTKVFTELEGKTQATIEVVAQIEGVGSNSSRLLHIGSNGDTGRISLSSNVTNRIHFRWQGNSTPAGDWPLDYAATGRAVLHVVLDTTQATQSNRVRLYVDGKIVNGTSNISTQNQAISINAGRLLFLGNREDFARSFRGTLYYAAMYNRPLTDKEIGDNAALLKGNDDE